MIRLKIRTPTLLRVAALLLAVGVLLLSTSFLVAPRGDDRVPRARPSADAQPTPEPVADVAPDPPPPLAARQADMEREDGQMEGYTASGCRASAASEEGYPTSRSLSHSRERRVTTNATSLSAILALAGPFEGTVRPEDATSLQERADEVCLFAPADWREAGAEALLVRFLTVHERNVSLSRELAVHLLALGAHGAGFRIEDVLDVQEHARTLRIVEARVGPASDEELLHLAHSVPAQDAPLAAENVLPA